MANDKISQLPLATSPLDSAVIMPVVQGGVTKQAPVNTIGFLQSGTGAVQRTVQAKLNEFPTGEDFNLVESAINSNPANWFFLGSGDELPVTTDPLVKKYWGLGYPSSAPGQSIGDQTGAKGGFSIWSQIPPASGVNFIFQSKAFTGNRTEVGTAPGFNHVVAGYFETQRGAGSTDGVWAMNSITSVYNLGGPTIGYEIDMNNYSGVNPGLSDAYYGLLVVNGAGNRGTSAITIARNGTFSNNEWLRGIHVKDVLTRGIEFSNCGVATGFWSDFTTAFVQTAGLDPVIRVTPFSDTGPSGDLIRVTNAANSQVLAGWLKRGEIAINEPSLKGLSGVGIKGIANGDYVLSLQRFTDSGPGGSYIRAVNAANSLVLFDVDYNTTAAETNLQLSVAGAAVSRVSVGAADSGGAGFRVLRVPN
jgi:hypothetical protein